MDTILYTFLKGFVFGVTMAAIPGPIFFLIIQRTLAEGILTGIFCSLGAITADAFYALLAAVGLSFITQFLLDYQSLITLAGSFFLFYLGISTFYSKQKAKTAVDAEAGAKAAEVKDKSLIGAWLSTFLLTIANPVTIVSYCIIFAGLGLAEHQNYSAVFSMISGVILGAASVVAALIVFLYHFRQKLSISTISKINKVAGIILIAFSVTAFLRGMKALFQ